MPTLWLTFILAFVISLLALIGMAISYLLTGKDRMVKRCGYTPKTAKDPKRCGKDVTCPLCENEVKPEVSKQNLLEEEEK